MIRTAILAAMLLVMLSMAYSRTGQLPDLRMTQEPAIVQPEVAAVREPVAPPSPRVKITERPGIDPASPMTPVRPTISRTARVTAPAPTPLAEAPAEELLAPASVPQAEPLPAPEPVPAAVAEPPIVQPPVMAKAVPIPAEPAVPTIEQALAAPAIRDVTPVDEMPVRQVATPRVMMPRDLPLPSEAPVPMKMGPRTVAAADIMADGFPAPPPGSNVTSAPPEATPQKQADAPQFMSREERTRELYKLAREMEDTFISKLTR